VNTAAEDFFLFTHVECARNSFARSINCKSYENVFVAICLLSQFFDKTLWNSFMGFFFREFNRTFNFLFES